MKIYYKHTHTNSNHVKYTEKGGFLFGINIMHNTSDDNNNTFWVMLNEVKILLSKSK